MTEILAGQHYRATKPVDVIALTHWSAPFTGGYDVVLPAGEVFEIIHDPVPGATAVGCRPLRYADLEVSFIPPDDRNARKYGGYSLTIPVAFIRESAELVSGVPM
jgi:hypothetical protein